MPDVPGQLKTVQSGIARLSGESPSPNVAASKPATSTDLSPTMQAAYERRRGPNYGKDINLPMTKTPAAKPMRGAK